MLLLQSDVGRFFAVSSCATPPVTCRRGTLYYMISSLTTTTTTNVQLEPHLPRYHFFSSITMHLTKYLVHTKTISVLIVWHLSMFIVKPVQLLYV